MDAIKILVVIVLIGIVGSLGSALFHLSNKKGDPDKMVKSLSIRVGLSLALFILLMAAWYFGLITPHGLAK